MHLHMQNIFKKIIFTAKITLFNLKHGSTQQLKPYQRRSSKTPIVRPLSRKDIFYSGSIYNLALDLTTDDEKENKQIADLNALKGYRHSVVSIPRNITFSHRGSIGQCMYIILIICLKEIGSVHSLIKKKLSQ